MSIQVLIIVMNRNLLPIFFYGLKNINKFSQRKILFSSYNKKPLDRNPEVAGDIDYHQG